MEGQEGQSHTDFTKKRTFYILFNLNVLHSNIYPVLFYCHSNMSKMHEPPALLKPDVIVENYTRKIIPTFQIPYVHRDMWNDKDWYYPIEGKRHVFSIMNFD